MMLSGGVSLAEQHHRVTSEARDGIVYDCASRRIEPGPCRDAAA